MAPKYRTPEEITQIAREILESFRPEHFTIGQIHAIADRMKELTNNIVFREAEEK